MISAFAAERGLAERVPNARELAAGFTEVYDGGGTIKVREETLGRWLEVEITEPGRGPSMRTELSRRLGILPPAPEPRQ